MVAGRDEGFPTVVVVGFYSDVGKEILVGRIRSDGDCDGLGPFMLDLCRSVYLMDVLERVRKEEDGAAADV
ncbi:hypothetical protein M8C21_004147 [Ambrosia artemisiifolia]|uniref:Uncharacterized protein n=1 Tax=Ambrosia artemisiifolia TaxID=4212 RepID=A0AAD5D3W1_AMBAR|nr:hypothetical protein M8C21_004147 [Ambrosia artemisiifolia]